MLRLAMLEGTGGDFLIFCLNAAGVPRTHSGDAPEVTKVAWPQSSGKIS
jgi:hypothetical protein